MVIEMGTITAREWKQEVDTVTVVKSLFLIQSLLVLNDILSVENDPCNETIGLGRCPHTAECYEKFRECDGFFDCADGYDETACEFNFCALNTLILSKFVSCM